MNSDLRRSKRYNDFIAVSILARNQVNGNGEADSSVGRIINISRHGACLLMPLGAPEACDVYRSTSKKDSIRLEIRGGMDPGLDVFMLAARPIWMDPFILDDIRAFKMGVDFTSGTETDQADIIIDNMFDIVDKQ
ncbi:MAG: PilZ domain-containing protein [Desulfobulbaceae bacterium]|nr:PilZ domain-containing protein [Desulfobulbaceae bacterium]